MPPPAPAFFLLYEQYCMSQIDTVCKVPGLHEYTHMDGHKAHCLMRCQLQLEYQII